MTGRVDCSTETTTIGELRDTTELSRGVRPEGPPGFPRIALLTPYNGENLGDASIQHAIITNLHRRLPNAEFSGVTMSDANFVEQHGRSGFPLYGWRRPFFRLKTTDRAGGEGSAQAVRPARFTSLVRKLIRLTPADRAARRRNSRSGGAPLRRATSRSPGVSLPAHAPRFDCLRRWATRRGLGRAVGPSVCSP